MNKKKKIFQRKVAFFVLATVMIIVAVLGNYGLRSAKKSAEEKESDNLMGYFVDTNPDYTERYQDELAEMALNLNFFDFNALVSDYYHDDVPICTPIEATDGSTTYRYSFQTPFWQVDLSTVMDNETCLITSWIDLYQENNSDVYYEYQSPPVRIKPSNYVANLSGNSSDGTTNLFFVEREAFAHFLMLVKTGSFNQEFVVPFDMAQVPYQKLQPIPTSDPAN